MLKTKTIYGMTAINLFILLPLLTEATLPDWSFSFSQLACFFCPLITLLIVVKIVQLELIKTYHGAINLMIQLLIGVTSIIISFLQFR